MKGLLYIAVFLTAVLGAGCKVSYKMNDGQIPIEAKTFSVSTFRNTSSLGPPTLSQRLTERFKDLMQAQSPLNVVKEDGDLQFEGTIIDYRISAAGIQNNDQAAQNKLTIKVVVKYTNRYDETADYEQTFSRFENYSSDLDLTTVEDELISDINAQLSQDFYNKAFGKW